MAKPVIREEIVTGYVKSTATKIIPEDIIRLIQIMIHSLMLPNIMYYTLDLRDSMFILIRNPHKRVDWDIPKKCITFEGIKWMKNVFFVELQKELADTNDISSILRVVWTRAVQTGYNSDWDDKIQKLFSKGAISFIFHAMASHEKYGKQYPIWQCLYLGGKEKYRMEFVSDALEIWVEHTGIDTSLDEYKECEYDDYMDFRNVFKIFNLLSPFFEFMAAIEEYCARMPPDESMSTQFMQGIWWDTMRKKTTNKRELVKHLLKGIMPYKIVYGFWNAGKIRKLDDEYLDKCMKAIGDKEITFEFFVEELRLILCSINQQ